MDIISSQLIDTRDTSKYLLEIQLNTDWLLCSTENGASNHAAHAHEFSYKNLFEFLKILISSEKGLGGGFDPHTATQISDLTYTLLIKWNAILCCPANSASGPDYHNINNICTDVQHFYFILRYWVRKTGMKWFHAIPNSRLSKLPNGVHRRFIQLNKPTEMEVYYHM